MSELKKLFEKMYIQNAPSWSIEQDEDGSYKYHATKSAFTLFEIQQAKIDACSALISQWREKPMGGWSDYARGGLHSRQDCSDDLEKALRGANDINLPR